MPIEFKQTIPLLRIFDEAKATEFYREFLGFQIDWAHRFEDVAPVYMQVSRAGCTFHLTEHYGDCCPGSTVFVWMTGIQEFHAEVSAKSYGYMRPGIEKTFYDAYCMEVIDPFGNRIRFHEAIDKTS
jgi:uncharacterized glyoxalase superfamily protein PhnB